MPYVAKERRPALDAGQLPESPGELTYVISRAINRYLQAHGERFQTYSELLGSLTAIQHELYRRLIGRYEDRKLLDHGDVFGQL